MPAIRPWSSDSLPSVAETRLVEQRLELHRQRAGLQHERDVLASLAASRPVICGVAALDAVRVVPEVDRRVGRRACCRG